MLFSRVAVLIFLFWITGTSAQTWSGLGSGMNGEVTCITFYNGDLIAAGNFTLAGGVSAKRIARWDGTSWHPLGNGLNALANNMAVYDGDLYVTGYFSMAGTKFARKIARWNGLDWDSVGGGITTSGWVGAMKVYQNELYVGGTFTKAGNITVQNIAKWNGTAWSDVGGGMVYSANPSYSVVESLEEFNNELYAGGIFTSAGTTPVTMIANWDGFGWMDLNGTGVSNAIASLHTHQGALYAGGRFQYAGGISSNRLAAYSNGNWDTFGTRISGDFINSFASIGNTLFIAGSIVTADGIPVNNIMSYNGVNFSELNAGVDSTVWTLATDSQALYVGGTFTNAGGHPAKYIAKWIPENVGIHEHVQSSVKAYPSPNTNGEFIMEFDGYNDKECTIMFTNVQGKEILRKNRDGRQRLHLTLPVSPGIYFYSVQSDEHDTVNGKVIIQ